MEIGYVFLVFVYTLTVFEVDGDEDKRLILHSDTDIAQEVVNLRKELMAQKIEIQSLSSSLAAKDQDIREHATTLQNITSLLNAKQNQLNSIQTEITKMQSVSIPGSSYVRWGRTSCGGNGSSLVYSGFMAGSRHDETGGAANYLCLTDTPTWDYYDETIDAYAGIYGVEYQFYAFHADGASKFFGSNVLDDDAPCAVCVSPRSTNIMVPGTNQCKDGWTKEYAGYLVTNYYGYHRTEYICLDRRPDRIVGGRTNDDESMLYLVEAKCGKGLECPPYINGRELTCVVCSI